MAIDMNPEPAERLRLAKEALDASKADWYRTHLNQPENDQKKQLLDGLEERADRAAAEIKKLEPEVAKAEKAAAAEAAKAEKEAKAAAKK